jgi:hypothetical protein
VTISALHARNVDFAFIETPLLWLLLELITTERRHAGDGSGGGRSSAISRRISANSILGTATSAIWKATTVGPVGLIFVTMKPTRDKARRDADLGGLTSGAF